MTRIVGVALSLLFAAARRPSGEPERSIGTWAAATEPALLSTVLGVRNQTLRLIARTSVGGASVRINVSNIFGDRPLVIGSVHIARRRAAAQIDPSTDRALTLGGQTTVTIPARSVDVSDPVNLEVPPLADLAVSLFLPDSTRATTSHI